MDLSAVFIKNLVEFFTIEEIRRKWKEAADALMARSTSTLHINMRSRDGASSTAIELASPEEMGAFCEACSSAIDQLKGTTTVDPNQLGNPVTFAYKSVQV